MPTATAEQRGQRVTEQVREAVTARGFRAVATWRGDVSGAVVGADEGEKAAAVLDERERLAAALHGTTMRELFALGLSLQAVTSLADGEIQRRLNDVVDDLDRLMADLRRTLFELAPSIASSKPSDGRRRTPSAGSRDRALHLWPAGGGRRGADDQRLRGAGTDGEWRSAISR